MTATTRIWFAFAAVGAGMIHLAVAAGAPLLLTIVLAGFGIAELGWGVGVLVRGRLLVARVVLGAALVPVLFWGAIATVGSGWGPVAGDALPLFPMAVASLFDLFVAATLAVHGRRHAASDTPARAPAATARQDWGFLAALTVAGALFSGLVTPALAATEAGSKAVPHGSHGIPGLEFLDAGHGHHH
ncbi:hypothetical protein [Cryobacterium tepidiphilum]|uniref:Uncharacterized protein n=1 Tax=Cryobacterium tepidiphilum TaxID=2486026 RepID=A0A3M8LAL0_9MICO|nr:hypothetical protein [Cryobacterium tepidiphilum]RNE62490.1 hypothetical protein EEJ31_07680 [Cryobacterium tepidiphilum]